MTVKNYKNVLILLGIKRLIFYFVYQNICNYTKIKKNVKLLAIVALALPLTLLGNLQS